MVRNENTSVTPAEAGVQQWPQGEPRPFFWIPAFAGMTVHLLESFQ